MADLEAELTLEREKELQDLMKEELSSCLKNLQRIKVRLYSSRSGKGLSMK